MTQIRREQGYTAYRQGTRDPVQIVSLPKSERRNGQRVTTRRLYAIDGMDVFDNGNVMLHCQKVKRIGRDRVNPSFGFLGTHNFFTQKAWQLSDMRPVAVVGGFK